MSTKTTPQSHYHRNYAPNDPLLQPQSHLYSFPLHWRRHKYFPIAYPRDWATIQSAVLIMTEVINHTLKSIPPMSTQRYANLFKAFPVSIGVDDFFTEGESMVRRGGYDSKGYQDRIRNRSKGIGGVEGNVGDVGGGSDQQSDAVFNNNNSLNQSTFNPNSHRTNSGGELVPIHNQNDQNNDYNDYNDGQNDQKSGYNLYNDFFSFELLHLIAPIYPQVQPPRDIAYGPQRKKFVRGVVGAVGLLALLDLVL